MQNFRLIENLNIKQYGENFARATKRKPKRKPKQKEIRGIQNRF